MSDFRAAEVVILVSKPQSVLVEHADFAKKLLSKATWNAELGGQPSYPDWFLC